MNSPKSEQEKSGANKLILFFAQAYLVPINNDLINFQKYPQGMSVWMTPNQVDRWTLA